MNPTSSRLFSFVRQDTCGQSLMMKPSALLLHQCRPGPFETHDFFGYMFEKKAENIALNRFDYGGSRTWLNQRFQLHDLNAFEATYFASYSCLHLEHPLQTICLYSHLANPGNPRSTSRIHCSMERRALRFPYKGTEFSSGPSSAFSTLNLSDHDVAMHVYFPVGDV